MQTGLMLTEIDIVNERAVIGCACCGDEHAHYIFSNISAHHFISEKMRDLFAELKRLWTKYGKIDAAILASSKQGKELATCMQTVPALSNYKRYVKATINKWTQIEAGMIGQKLVMGEYEDIDIASGELSALTADSETDKIFSMYDMAVKFHSDRLSGKKPKYIRAGMGIDDYVRFRPGDMVVVGARPSCGKTAFGLQMALNMSNEKNVVFFSLETSAENIFEKFYSAHFNENYKNVQNYDIDVNSTEFIKNLDSIVKKKITVVEAAGKSASWITSEALRLKADVIMVDYIGLVNGEGKSMYEKVTNISMDFHTFAQRHKIMTVVLAQINRGGTDMPKVQYLKDSGQIEQDADVIILLHRENENQYDESTTAIVAKNKTGECGLKRLNYNKQTQRILAEV